MKVKINIHYNQYRQNKDATFTGLWDIKTPSNIGRNSAKLLGDKYGNTIGEQSNKIVSMIENVSKDRVAFLKNLVSKYRKENFYLKTSKKENAKPLLNIFNMVKRPQTEHFNVVSKSQMQFKTLESVFLNAEGPEGLRFVQTIQHNILDGTEKSAEHIIEMLKSPHRENYLKNPQDYRAYLILNSFKKNAVKDLDKLIDEGKYDRKTYDIKLEIINLMKNKKIKPILEKFPKYIEEHYTPEGMKFLNRLCNNYLAHRGSNSFEENRQVLLMYTSTTPHNINTRLEIIDKFKSVTNRSGVSKKEISAMWKLFDKIDSDKHVENFVNKVLGDNIKTGSIEELNKIIDTVPPQKAEIFHKNIARIVENTNPEEREHILEKEIENPFYKNPKIKNKFYIRPQKGDNLFTKLAKIVENKINIIRYNKIKSESETQKSKFVTYHTDTKSIKMIASINIPKLENTLMRIDNTPDTKIRFVSILKQSPQAQKLRIKHDINEIITKKLGSKTKERQQKDYEKKATAIRLKMLPEIFNSIIVTRQAQKLSGKKPNIENKDVLKLYEKVQGKNKKLVRYMLKQTDENNNRLYTVKDIIKVLDNSEKEITLKKKTNPDFRAKDAKAYYDNIYTSMVKKYGTLTKTKKH